MASFRPSFAAGKTPKTLSLGCFYRADAIMLCVRAAPRFLACKSAVHFAMRWTCVASPPPFPLNPYSCVRLRVACFAVVAFRSKVCGLHDTTEEPEVLISSLLNELLPAPGSGSSSSSSSAAGVNVQERVCLVGDRSYLLRCAALLLSLDFAPIYRSAPGGEWVGGRLI